MHLSRLPLLTLLAVGGPLPLLVGCKDSAAGTPIEIGHIYDVTQNDNEFRATEMAKDDLNADPARLPQGRRIQIRHAPGGSKPEAWEGQAARLIAFNQVSALICGGLSEDAEKVGAAIQGKGLVAVSTAGWSAIPSQGLFTIGLAPSERGRALARYAKDKKPKTILVVRDPLAKAANRAADRFLAELSSDGIRVSETDAANDNKPMADAVFFACSARVALKYRPKNSLRLFGGDPAELLLAGSDADGLVVAVPYCAGAQSEALGCIPGEVSKGIRSSTRYGCRPSVRFAYNLGSGSPAGERARPRRHSQ